MDCISTLLKNKPSKHAQQAMMKELIHYRKLKTNMLSVSKK